MSSIHSFTTGFLIFDSTYRNKVKDALKLCGKSTNSKQVMRELIRLWNNLSDLERLMWNSKYRGFILFVCTFRPEVKAALELCRKSSHSKYLIPALVKRWKSLSDFERSMWDNKAVNFCFIKNTIPITH